MSPAEGILISVPTPLGFIARVDSRRWDLITSVKHPVMAGHEADIEATLARPDEIRQSRFDPDVLLFYKRAGVRRWYCAVVKRSNQDTFMITAYPTDAIKEGLRIWPN